MTPTPQQTRERSAGQAFRDAGALVVMLLLVFSVRFGDGVDEPVPPNGLPPAAGATGPGPAALDPASELPPATPALGTFPAHEKLEIDRTARWLGRTSPPSDACSESG